MKSSFFSATMVISIVFTSLSFLSCNKSDGDNSNPVLPNSPEYDWEGEVGKFNEAYRDSLVFSSDRAVGTSFIPSVHIMYKDGSGIRSLTNRWFTFAASWSPRKWKLFYVSDTTFDKPARGLFIMEANGLNNHRLTPPSEDVWGVDCAPDGKSIAYIVLDDQGRGKIRIAKPDGSQARDITGYFGPNTFHTVSWSSDSKRIAFDGHTDGIGIVNGDGSGFGSLFHYSYQCIEPAWSPDGKKLAFVSFSRIDSTYYTKIFSIELASGTITQLSTTRTDQYAPCWSPDSKYIVFTSNTGSGQHLHRMNADGTDVIELTGGTGADNHASW